mgnify:CR=1 FL=1
MEFKGYTYGHGARRGEYRSEAGIKSQELLYQTGINWMCLALSLTQETAHSTKIEFDFACYMIFMSLKSFLLLGLFCF